MTSNFLLVDCYAYPYTGGSEIFKLLKGQETELHGRRIHFLEWGEDEVTRCDKTVFNNWLDAENTSPFLMMYDWLNSRLQKLRDLVEEKINVGDIIVIENGPHSMIQVIIFYMVFAIGNLGILLVILYS